MPVISVVILLVTWLPVGQAPVSYQVEFTTLDKCQSAKDQLYGLRGFAEKDFLNDSFYRSKGSVTAKQPPPDLIAICAAK
jgi:hypothetical protein